jgi:HAE1 family hydrophobic/amphiphilic exporter-1
LPDWRRRWLGLKPALRVPVGDVFSALTSYVGSTYINQFNKFGLSLQVYVQADSQFRLQPDDLMNMYVRSQDGNMVPIGTLAHLGPLTAPSLITLYNLYPCSTIIGAPAKGFSSGQAMASMEDIAAKTLPSDVGYEWSAMSYQGKVTGNLLYWGFALSAACLSCPRRAIRELDPAARRDLGDSACAARAGDNANESRGRQ